MKDSLAEIKKYAQIVDNQINTTSLGKWGRMGPQHLIEHLSLVLLASTGKWGNTFSGDEAKAAKSKAIFFGRKYPFPKGITMPGTTTGQAPPALRYGNIKAAKDTLKKTIEKYNEFVANNPDAKVNHDYFGLLSVDEWAHFHVKHFEHHLMQFGVLPEPLTPEMQDHIKQIAEKLEIVYKEITLNQTAKWGLMNAQEMVEHLGFVFVYATGKFGIPFKGDLAAAERLWPAFVEATNPWKTVFPPTRFTKSPPPLRFNTMEESKKSLKKSFLKYIPYCQENPIAITPHGFLGNISTAQWLLVHSKHIDHHLAQFGVTTVGV